MSIKNRLMNFNISSFDTAFMIFKVLCHSVQISHMGTLVHFYFCYLCTNTVLIIFNSV